jgi:multidrug efflux pump subunit AcrB
MRELSPDIPEAESLIFGIGASTAVFGKPISFALISRDLEELRQAKDALKDRLRERKDIKDISDTDQVGVKQLILSLKPQATALGLSIGQIMNQVRAGFFGLEVQSLQRGEDEVKVWVRYPRTDRQNTRQLGDMMITDARGNSYQLSNLVDIEDRIGSLAIHHLNGQREVRVEANVATIDVSAPTVISEIEEAYMPAILEQYPGVSFSVEGQNRASFKMLGAIQVIGPVILLFIFGLIVLNFNSFSQAFLVFSLFPFAIIGVVLGHWIQGMALNIFSFVGTIALIGIFVNNSLVFISTLNQRLQENSSWKDALFQTAESRFRPIILTTITTVAGLAPLIASSSIGAQFLKGPAIAIAYGLSFGLFNVLVLLPALLHLFNGWRVFSARLFKQKDISPERVEPAVKSLKYKIQD